ncbi:MAG: succinylglutamate desuccinylase/aspartoacylase family protein [Deltaproteobacteria bacterium]|nr:succinylglutamate desuccinylase/aspartoacylase family protein [Deltaproteobacteria bacterium]
MHEQYNDPEIFEIGDQKIRRGRTHYFELTIGRLYDYTALSLPVCVIRGKKPGPVFFLSGAIHGDEVIGVEIIRRLLHSKNLRIARGTLICIPIVNVFGFNNKSRYLPDRRDLNRSFPGSDKGSLSARLAHLFLNQVILRSHFGIDLHSAAVHRSNLPQIRACLDHKATEDLATAFGAPVIINSKARDGSVRDSAEAHGISVLVFEGGEALRHDENVIRFAQKGILRCLRHAGMLPMAREVRTPKPAFIAQSSYWIRADQSGSIRSRKSLGDFVPQDGKLGLISDVFGENTSAIKAKKEGVIIGENRLPLVNQGDALFHIATFDDNDIEQMPDNLPDYVD